MYDTHANENSGYEAQGGYTDDKGNSLSSATTIDLYEMVENDNVYACLEIWKRFHNDAGQGETVLQALTRAAEIILQDPSAYPSDIASDIFREIGKLTLDFDTEKGYEYLGLASELGDPQANLILAKRCMSDEQSSSREQALRYLDRIQSYDCDETMYEVGETYMKCGSLIKGKSILLRLFKQPDLSDELWTKCALYCQEETTPETIIDKIWAIEGRTEEETKFLFHYYQDPGQSGDISCLTDSQIWELAQIEYNEIGKSGPIMKYAEEKGIQSAIDFLEEEQRLELIKKRENERKRKQIEQEQLIEEWSDPKKIAAIEYDKTYWREKHIYLPLFSVLFLVSILAGFQLAGAAWMNWLWRLIVLMALCFGYLRFIDYFSTHDSERLLMILFIIFFVIQLFSEIGFNGFMHVIFGNPTGLERGIVYLKLGTVFFGYSFLYYLFTRRQEPTEEPEND